MSAATRHIAVIQALFDEAEKRGILLWLESGWAIDARLGKVTREHDDIDIAFAAEQEVAYLELLESLGFNEHETMEYGFLSRCGDVLLDSEPCFEVDGEYNFEKFPCRSCPLEKEGVIAGCNVRCVSWDALYFEFLDYIREVPQTQWRDKDFRSFGLIEAHLDEDQKQTLKNLFAQMI